MPARKRRLLHPDLRLLRLRPLLPLRPLEFWSGTVRRYRSSA
ncbi:MAG TPA: hypothetical protein VGK73_29265 [Polyangiaceae bacterium]